MQGCVDITTQPYIRLQRPIKKYAKNWLNFQKGTEMSRSTKVSLSDFKVILQSYIDRKMTYKEMIKLENLSYKTVQRLALRSETVRNLLIKLKSQDGIDVDKHGPTRNIVRYAILKLKVKPKEFAKLISVNDPAVYSYRSGAVVISCERFLQILKITDPDLHREIFERIKKYGS